MRRRRPRAHRAGPRWPPLMVGGPPPLVGGSYTPSWVGFCRFICTLVDVCLYPWCVWWWARWSCEVNWNRWMPLNVLLWSVFYINQPAYKYSTRLMECSLKPLNLSWCLVLRINARKVDGLFLLYAPLTRGWCGLARLHAPSNILYDDNNLLGCRRLSLTRFLFLQIHHLYWLT